MTFMHYFFSHKKKFSYFKHLSRERETRLNVRQGVGWRRRVEVEQKRLWQKVYVGYDDGLRRRQEAGGWTSGAD